MDLDSVAKENQTSVGRRFLSDLDLMSTLSDKAHWLDRIVLRHRIENKALVSNEKCRNADGSGSR